MLSRHPDAPATSPEGRQAQLERELANRSRRVRSALTLPAAPASSLDRAARQRAVRRALTRLALAHSTEYLGLLAEETDVERAGKGGGAERG